MSFIHEDGKLSILQNYNVTWKYQSMKSIKHNYEKKMYMKMKPYFKSRKLKMMKRPYTSLSGISFVFHFVEQYILLKAILIYLWQLLLI